MAYRNETPNFTLTDVNEVKKTFGLNVKRIRQERSYSQAHVSNLVGMSTTHWARIESNQVEPRLETMVKIADVLQVHLSELFISHEDNNRLEFNCTLKNNDRQLFSKESLKEKGWTNHIELHREELNKRNYKKHGWKWKGKKSA